MRGESILVRQLLKKAKDSALLAIEFYNKPAVSFKSEGFIVMMCIAWTSFFHAYFLKNKIKPFYKKKEHGKKSRFVYIYEEMSDGKKIKQKKWWELSKCLEEFFKVNNDIPVYKNIQFLNGLRNLIVHRNLPELDVTIFAECQACVLNFNNYLEKYFGQKHKIDMFLSFSIQLFNNPKNFLEVGKNELKKKNATEIVEYIKSFRASLSSDILEDPNYSFKAVLIKVKNHESKDALAIRFLNEKDLTEEQRKQLLNMGVVMIKEKQVFHDGVPEEYNLNYKQLIEKLKGEIPSLKVNRKFHEIKNSILSKNPELRHTRYLDSKNPKSPKKDFYSSDIIKYFKDKYQGI